MILEYKIECTIHSHRTRDGIIDLCAGDCPSRILVHFTYSADIQCFTPIRLDLLDQVAIAVVDNLDGFPLTVTEINLLSASKAWV